MDPISPNGKEVEISRSRFNEVAAALLAAIVVATALWYYTSRNHSQELVRQKRELEQQWADFQGLLLHAQKVQANTEAISAASEVRRWAPALRSIAMNWEEGIELNSVRVDPKVSQARACQLDIEGTAKAMTPQVLAYRFFQNIERQLVTDFHGAVSTRLEGIKEAPDASDNTGTQRGSHFKISTIVILPNSFATAPPRGGS